MLFSESSPLHSNRKEEKLYLSLYFVVLIRALGEKKRERAGLVGILRKVKSVKFVYRLMLLQGTLQPLSKLPLILQSDDVDGLMSPQLEKSEEWKTGHSVSKRINRIIYGIIILALFYFCM